MMNLDQISDPLIRAGVGNAIEKTLLPAAAEKAYPGHFFVVADGSHYGGDSTWPGLDSWELAGAYLLLGKARLVRDYFAFVRASQRADGNVPIAIMPADTPPGGLTDYGRGMRYPQDVYEYAPFGQKPRKWIGLFHHWQMKVNPLSVLGSISYILTAAESWRAGKDAQWLKEYQPSIELAGKYVLSRKSENGLIAGAGFYIETPPRNQWDGVTQCYAVHAFRLVAELSGDDSWDERANELTAKFREIFWRDDHFAEYVHPEHGVVDSHGLSDVNWAAVAWDVAADEQAKKLWPRMMAEKLLWAGEMPTQLVSKPATTYEKWELHEELPFHHVNGTTYDVAAMGRVWFLEAMACVRMKEWDRLRESARLVSKMGEKHGWMWFERYHAQADGTVKPAGPKGYCEYAAILTRVVLGNLERFT
ncbi:MAG: hypothetical protein QOF78_4346 [Phycisphaerales bacterium]|nr:hypothetical protein [Phycisphaerales bacterium]